jgi:hypothetical protein
MAYSIVHDTIWEAQRLDAALAKLLGNTPDPDRWAHADSGPDTHWGWLEPPSSASGMEISEHPLPAGMDFVQFQDLIWGQA